MPVSKPVLMSKTVWTNAIGLLAFALSTLGFDTSTLDSERLVENVLQAIVGLSFVFSTLFRIVATRRLG